MTFVSALTLEPGQYVLYVRDNEADLPVFKFIKHPSKVKTFGGQPVELSDNHRKYAAQWTMHSEEGPRLYFSVSFGNCKLKMDTWKYTLTWDDKEYEPPQMGPSWVDEIRLVHGMDIWYDKEYEPAKPPEDGASSSFFRAISPERIQYFGGVPFVLDRP